MEQERPVPDLLTLVVTDMEATVAFYRKLGLEIGDAMPEWEDVHRSAKSESGLQLDFDRADFAPAWNRGWKGGPAGAGVILGFSVASREAVDQLYAELSGAGYRSQQAPYDGFWGARYAVIEDPDGNAVGITSAGGCGLPDRRSRAIGAECRTGAGCRAGDLAGGRSPAWCGSA